MRHRRGSKRKQRRRLPLGHRHRASLDGGSRSTGAKRAAAGLSGQAEGLAAEPPEVAPPEVAPPEVAPPEAELPPQRPPAEYPFATPAKGKKRFNLLVTDVEVRAERSSRRRKAAAPTPPPPETRDPAAPEGPPAQVGPLSTQQTSRLESPLGFAPPGVDDSEVMDGATMAIPELGALAYATPGPLLDLSGGIPVASGPEHTDRMAAVRAPLLDEASDDETTDNTDGEETDRVAAVPIPESPPLLDESETAALPIAAAFEHTDRMEPVSPEGYAPDRTDRMAPVVSPPPKLLDETLTAGIRLGPVSDRTDRMLPVTGEAPELLDESAGPRWHELGKTRPLLDESRGVRIVREGSASDTLRVVVPTAVPRDDLVDLIDERALLTLLEAQALGVPGASLRARASTLFDTDLLSGMRDGHSAPPTPEEASRLRRRAGQTIDGEALVRILRDHASSTMNADIDMLKRLVAGIIDGKGLAVLLARADLADAEHHDPSGARRSEEALGNAIDGNAIVADLEGEESGRPAQPPRPSLARRPLNRSPGSSSYPSPSAPVGPSAPRAAFVLLFAAALVAWFFLRTEEPFDASASQAASARGAGGEGDSSGGGGADRGTIPDRLIEQPRKRVSIVWPYEDSEPAPRPRVERLESDNGTTRREEVIRLGDGDSSSVPALIDALQDPDRRVRDAARQSLARVRRRYNLDIVGQISESFAEVDAAGRRQLVSGLGAAGGAAVPHLSGVLGSEAAAADRLLAVAALGHTEDPDAIDVLLPYLEDENPVMRAEACRSLGRLRRVAAVEPLISRLDDEAENVRGLAHWALKRITGQGLLPKRRYWLSWWNQGIGQVVDDLDDLTADLLAQPPADQLARLQRLAAVADPRVVDVARDALWAETPAVREEAARVLGTQHHFGIVAVPDLIEALAAEAPLAVVAHRSLRDLTGRHLPLNADAWARWWVDEGGRDR